MVPRKFLGPYLQVHTCMHATSHSLLYIHIHTHRGGDSISRIIYLHASTWEPITPSLRRLKQGDPEFEAQLG